MLNTQHLQHCTYIRVTSTTCYNFVYLFDQNQSDLFLNITSLLNNQSISEYCFRFINCGYVFKELLKHGSFC